MTIRRPNLCVDCGNDFIEIFGDRGKWWCGCKPCSKSSTGWKDHVTGKSRNQAIDKWDAANPVTADQVSERKL